LSGQPSAPAQSGGGLGEIISEVASAATGAGLPEVGQVLSSIGGGHGAASAADAHKIATQHGGGAATKFAPGTSIDIGATENKPELLQTIPITTQPGASRQVVLSLGADSDTDSPLPDIAGGDRLEVLAELELTTDAADPNHPGLIGNAYSYAPDVEATLLLAADASVTEAGAQGIELAPAWWQSISQERHHGVVTFNNGAATIPGGGLPWGKGSRINLVVSASNPAAKDGDVLLVGQNEKTPVVVQDMSGIRVVRFRPANAQAPAPLRQTTCLCGAIPVSKARVVVLSQELAGLQTGERLLIKASLATDAAGLPAPARISTRLFIGDSPTQDEPGGAAQQAVTWKGNLSKYTGFNCLPAEGPMVSEKFGVATVRQAPAGSLFVNLVAVSAAPFGGVAASQGLRIDPSRSVLEVTRLGVA
jgi:hypothetical protein